MTYRERGAEEEESAYGAWLAGRWGKTEGELPMDGDEDGDGATNWEEYVADTNPLDGEEVFKTRISVRDGKVWMEPSVTRTGRAYRAKVTGDLREDGEWVELGSGREGLGVELPAGAGMGFGTIAVSIPE